MNARELAIVLNPREAYCCHNDEIKHYLLDSRSFLTAQGTVFVAIKTSSGDGHKYIDKVYRLGVRSFIIEESIQQFVKEYPKASFISVESSIKALQKVAQVHRSALIDKEVVGITGSNGKTVVKEFLNELLFGHLQIKRSPASYNSQIGVPLSVLSLDEEMNLGLIEAGISDPNTMDALEEVIQPTIGILTSVGTAHIEHFQSQEALLEEKLKLFRSCRKVFAPLDELQDYRSLVDKLVSCSLEGWSSFDEEALLYVEKIEKHKSKSLVYAKINKLDYKIVLPFVDDANISNALLSLVFIASTYPQYLTECIEQVKELQGVEMRLELKDSYGHNTIINDAYSCDFESLRIALDFQRRRCQYSQMPAVVILSDIMQTGLDEVILYSRVARLLESFGIVRLFAVGESISKHKELFQSIPASFYNDTNELISASELKQIKSSCILIKGARKFAFERLIRSLSLMEHQTTLEVNLSAIRHNLNYYKALLPSQHPLICMIKADGYGLGALEIARLLEDSQVNYLAVALADEGKALRLKGIQSPIIVMNPEILSAETLFEYQLEPEVYSLKLLQSLIKEAEIRGLEDYPIHLKVDTGMHRLGFMAEDFDSLLNLLKQTKSLKIASIFSHLASADDEHYDHFTRQQASLLETFYKKLSEELGISPRMHLLNTAGIERFNQDYAYDMVRLGLGLYGISPTQQTARELRMVARLSSTILQVKSVKVGERIGYSCRGIAEREMLIGIIPIGYADGLPRSMGNGAWSMLVRDKLCPTVGNICMDTAMIDLTEVPEIQEGERVTIFGTEELNVNKFAEVAHLISYEVITGLSQRIKKVYLYE